LLLISVGTPMRMVASVFRTASPVWGCHRSREDCWLFLRRRIRI